MASAYFFDTSALLPRYLKHAPGYAWVTHICDPRNQNLIAIAEITETEIASSLHQLVRGGVLRKRAVEGSIELLWNQVGNGEYTITPLTSAIIRRAADLCSVRPLKSMDALQLACALSARDDVRIAAAVSATSGGPTFDDPIFLTEDNRLHDAAVAEGFVVDTPINHTSGS